MAHTTEVLRITSICLTTVPSALKLFQANAQSWAVQTRTKFTKIQKLLISLHEGVGDREKKLHSTKELFAALILTLTTNVTCQHAEGVGHIPIVSEMTANTKMMDDAHNSQKKGNNSNTFRIKMSPNGCVWNIMVGN